MFYGWLTEFFHIQLHVFLRITVFSEPWPPWEVFSFSFLPHVVNVDISVSRRLQRRQQQGRCCRASGWTARRERAGEGATRAIGARRGLWRHCRRRVDNVMRASNEQRMAGGCSDDGGGDVVARTAGGGRCDKTRWIRRTMRQHQTETADDGTRASGDKDGKQQDRNEGRRRMTGLNNSNSCLK